MIVFAVARIRVNLTGSLPLGLYVRHAAGPYVVFCPPEPWGYLALTRGYRQATWRRECQDGGMPLEKEIAARPGDMVTIEPDGVRVNSVLWPNTARMKDSAGRDILAVPYGTYRVHAGELWVLSSYHPRSFDSRYFGPISESSILERVEPLLVSK